MTLVPGRSCDGCTLCCKVIAVPELNKPRLSWCEHCEIGVGCQIFGQPQRPDSCSTYFCWYRQSEGLSEEWHPNVCHFAISYESRAKRINVCVDPDYPMAWRNEPYYARIKALAQSILMQGGHLVVWEGAEGVGVLPHKDVPLGRPTGDQVIVTGERITPNGLEFSIAALDRNDPRLRPQKA